MGLFFVVCFQAESRLVSPGERASCQRSPESNAGDPSQGLQEENEDEPATVEASKLSESSPAFRDVKCKGASVLYHC